MKRRASSLLSMIATALLLAACMPRLQELGPAAATGFIEPQLEQETLLTRDGLRLGLQKWEALEPHSILVALHGMGDYSNAFALPGPWWAERGVTTYAIDQRGHGRSPQRGIWPGSDLMIQDLEDLIKAARATHPGLPIYVLGHSMGGAVVIAAHGEGVLGVDGTILVAPAVWGWSSMPLPLRPLLWISAHVTPGATATGAGLERWPTDNIELLRANAADELMIRETRIDAIYGLVSLMERASDHAEQVPEPVLVLYGGNDQIIPPEPVTRAIQAMCPRRRAAIYPEAYHMLLRDLAGETAWQDILTFLEQPRGDQISAAETNGFETHSCSAGGLQP